MPDDGKGPTITIKLLLDTKDLSKGGGKLDGELKKLKGKLTMSLGKQSKQAIADLVKSLKDLTTAVQKSSGVVVTEETKKQKAFKQTSSEVDKQKSKIQELSKFAQSRTGKFLMAFAAGAGVGGLRRGITAESAGSLLGRGVSRGVGAVTGFALQGFQNAFAEYQQYGQALGGLVGLGTPGQLRGGRRAAGRAGGAALGYSMTETAQQAAGIGRATGNIGAVFKAQQAARATGMDVGEVGGYMGMIRQAGFGFGGMAQGPGGQMQQVGQSGPKQLEKIIAAGMASGIEKARLPEFLQGVAGITQAAGARAAGAVNVKDISAFQAVLGKSGYAGFQGTRGAAVAQQVMQATVTPGGGESGQAMMLQALGFGKPGGKSSYYDALRRQQQGMQKPENVMAMFKEVYSQLGATGKGGSAAVQQEANIALSEMSGLSLEQVEALGDIFNSGKNSEKQLEEMRKEIEKAEPLDKQALKEMKKGFGGTVTYLAGMSDMMVAIGSKVAPFMMQVAQLQLKALNWLANQIPSVVDWLKELYLSFRTLFDAITGKTAKGSSYEEAQQSAIDQSKLLERVYGKEGERTVLGDLNYQLRKTEMYKKQKEDLQKAISEDLRDPTNYGRVVGTIGSAITRYQRGEIGAGGFFSHIGRGVETAEQISMHTFTKNMKALTELDQKIALGRIQTQTAAGRVVTEQVGSMAQGKSVATKLKELDDALPSLIQKVEDVGRKGKSRELDARLNIGRPPPVQPQGSKR